MKDFIKINENDNVIVALKELTAGETILAGTQEVTARETIPAGHKMAIRDIATGAEVIKYGFRIGNAKENIAAGQWVHVHNLKTALGDLLEYTYEPVETNVKKTEDVKFMGFARANGKVGVRNEVWIIPTVGCVNNIATAMAKAANARVKGSVEEVIAFPHPYGCSQMGDDQEHTRTILADLVNHPNAGGVLVLGLGCENSNIGELKKYIGDYDENRVKFLVCQECEDEMEEGAKLLNELIDYASAFRARADQCLKADCRNEVRRQRWILRNYGQSAGGQILRSSDRKGRHHDPYRSAGNVWRGDASNEPLRQQGTVR